MASVSSTNILFAPPPPPPLPRFQNINILSSSYVTPPSFFDGNRCLIVSRSNRVPHALAPSFAVNSSSVDESGLYKVSDFMTAKASLHVVKPSTPVDQALETLVEKRITGFPVIDDEWNLVGVVSDYDLLALDAISGTSNEDTDLFPNVDSSWKTFNRIQKHLSKTKGKVVGDLMTPHPLVVRESTNLDDAARILIKTKYHRLPVVDGNGRLIGIITRGDIVRAALKIKNFSS